MPNISVMLQPSDVRQTLPCGCAVGSVASACGFGARLASTSHGSAAASASSAHMPSETRQPAALATGTRSEEHTSELQSQSNLVCRLLLEKKKNKQQIQPNTAPQQPPYIPQTTH